MSDHYKAMIVVISITLIVLFIARPVALRFMAPEDFARRRFLWLALLLSGFLIPNFWAYALVATIVLVYGVIKDPNPAALYMFLLLAMPPFGADIPTFGLMNQLFPLDHLRLMSLAVLLPAFARQWSEQARDPDPYARFELPDALIITFGLLQVLLWLPSESITASLRRVVLFGVDTMLPYYVLSRSCRTRQSLRETLFAFALLAVVLSCIAMFETLRTWVLFAGIEERWNTVSVTGFLRRGDTLRATVTGGHSIVLGYALMVAFGFWLSISQRLAGGWRWLGIAALSVGLAATFARGPWVGALIALFAYQLLQRNAVSRLGTTILVLSVGAAIVIASPWGNSFIDRLPFIGSDPGGSVQYRQRLAELSWQLIKRHPVFGSLDFMQYMEELRQGEGIIDIVNVYAGYALAYGLVGAGLFVAFFVSIGLRAVGVVWRTRDADEDMAALGTGLLASLAAALVTLATLSMYLSVSNLTWALAGLTAGYARIMNREQFAAAQVAAEAHQPRYAT